MVSQKRDELYCADEILCDAAARLKKAGLAEGRAEAEILLASILNIPRWRLYLQREEKIGLREAKNFQSALAKRERRVPLSYITGEKEFYGYSFQVTGDVLIPRPETEFLIDTVLAAVNEDNPAIEHKMVIADLGTGSGAIAVTLALLLPRAEIWALDISPAALLIARKNSVIHGVCSRIRFVRGSFEEIPRLLPRSLNLVVANPPYICSGNINQLAPEIKEYEPLQALDGGEDGLDSYRQILEALKHVTVRPPATLIMETGEDSLAALKDLCRSNPLISSLAFIKDYRGHERVMKATLATGISG